MAQLLSTEARKAALKELPGWVEVDDPNYGGRKHYRACPLAEVLAYGFGEPSGTTANDNASSRTAACATLL